MRTIKIKTSFEEHCSRLPGVVPAYEDNVLFYFDAESLQKDFYRHKSNYGMIPLNLVLSGVSWENDTLIPEAEDWSTCGIADLTELGDDACDQVVTMSWHHVSTIFAFFRKYYSLLNHYSSCGLVYSSATEYFKVGSNMKYSPNLMFGNDEETYLGFDETFLKYGGLVSSVTASDIHKDYDKIEGSEHEPIVHTFDIGFFKWLCDNIVPVFFVPYEYIDAYQTNILFYPDIVSWTGWLSRMAMKYSDDDPVCTDYKLSHEGGVTCCECEEYVKRGGKKMLDIMTEWLDKLNEVILENNKRFENNLEYPCQIPSIFYSVTLINSLEDLGLMSIFCNEWEGGVNYTNNPLNVDDTVGIGSGGTVVIYDNKPYIIKNINEIAESVQNSKLNDYMVGYKYDERLCKYVWGNGEAYIYQPDSSEKQYKRDVSQHWEDYTESVLNARREVFESAVDTYTYNAQKRFVGNPTPLDVSISVDVDTNDDLGFIVIADTYYRIEEKECVTFISNDNPYLNGKVLIVYREQITNTPYVMVQQRKKYAVLNDDGKYQFSFNTTACFEKKGESEDNMHLVVLIDDVYYPLISDKIKYSKDVLEETYNKVDGIFTYDGNTYLVNQGKVCQMRQMLDENNVVNEAYASDEWVECELASVEGESFEEGYFYYEYNSDEKKINICEAYEIYLANYITGYSTSMLDLVKCETLYYDDLGNPMDGFYDVQNTSKYAQPNEGEKLHLYHNVGNTTKLLASYISDSTQYYTGNILERMVFYYQNIDGTVNEDYMIECNLDNRTDSLTAILELEEKYQEYLNNTEGDGTVLREEMLCDVTYSIGATLFFSEGTGWVVNEDAHRGVEYFETVTVRQYQQQYMLSQNKGYSVFVYFLEQELPYLYLNDYDTLYQSPVARFKMQILTFNEELDKKVFTSENGFVTNNGLMIAPVYKREYLMGVAMHEFVQNGVNIDRGISSAFEKHIKLGEVMTFEALENYGNGFFKFLDN